MIIKSKKLAMPLINCRILRELLSSKMFFLALTLSLAICTIRVLDLSFNLLRNVPDRLEYLTSLHTIYFVQNKISKITGLTSCSLLRSLELGGNRIRVSGSKDVQSFFNGLKISF
jgi:Leucine-rich repeat (LRR) protein